MCHVLYEKEEKLYDATLIQIPTYSPCIWVMHSDVQSVSLSPSEKHLHVLRAYRSCTMNFESNAFREDLDVLANSKHVGGKLPAECIWHGTCFSFSNYGS